MAGHGYFDATENARATAELSPSAPSTFRDAERLGRMLDEEIQTTDDKDVKGAAHAGPPEHASPPTSKVKTADGAAPGRRRKAMEPLANRTTGRPHPGLREVGSGKVAKASAPT